MTDLEKYKATITLPVRYHAESGYILDAKDNIVAENRGWGRLCTKYGAVEGRRIQDDFGEKTAKAINDMFTEGK